MKQIVICILGLLILTSCRQPIKKTANKDSLDVKTKSNTVKSLAPLTDSAKLVMHLDSLTQIKFPFKSEAYNRNFDSINLSEFKRKKLFNIKVKLIPTVIGGGGVDDERADSTFDLVEKNYKGAWNLIVKSQGFVVVEVMSSSSNGVKLVTITYDLDVIDAINIAIADPAGHYPWFADRHAIIHKNLNINLQHEYTMNNTPTSVEKETSEEKWFIDKTGHFRKNTHQ